MAVITDIQLRPLKLADADAMAQFANNNKVQINLRDNLPLPYTTENAHSFISNTQNQQPALHFAIEYNGQFAGVVGLLLHTDSVLKSAEVGYWIGEPFWGKGIATRVLHSMTQLGFRRLKLNRLFAGVFEWNKAGMRVLEKCGYQLEGISYKHIRKNGQLVDEYWYGRTSTFY